MAGTKRGMTLGGLRRIALSLSAVHERSVHGTPGFYVAKKLFVWVLKDEKSIVVWMDLDRRAAVLKKAPKIFSITPHYDKHPMVIIQLATVGKIQLRDLLIDSWRQRAPRRLSRSLE